MSTKSNLLSIANTYLSVTRIAANLFWKVSIYAAFCVILFPSLPAQLIRQANTSLNLPPSLPRFNNFAFTNAFPGMSFSAPVAMTTPPGETDRLFIVEQSGSIQVINNLSTSPTKSVFLDVSSLVQFSGEQGLLGLAFHPQYHTNGYFYVFYVTSGTRYNRISRFSVSANPNVADPNSELILISQFDDRSNHNGGDLHFGPDGYLYASLGDEGGGNDNRNNSQKIDQDFFAGIICIDVDKNPGSLEPKPHNDGIGGSAIPLDDGIARYSIPPDNPFVGATTFNGDTINTVSLREEFWAVGLRNPWRMSFDIPTGRLFTGDVGQDSREEVDLIIKGGNYGWAFREGTIQRPGSGTPPAGFTHINPIFEYVHNGSQAVVGGIVYRGPQFAQLFGKYILGDTYDGTIWALEETSPGVWIDEIIGTESGVVAFGTDPATGDLLIADIFEGQIKKLISSGSPTGSLPATLTATGAFSNLATLTPHPGIVSYEPNVSFWSDFAEKQRWFSTPNLADTIDFSRDGVWTFPTGTVWIKHFDLELERGNPASARRIETRFIVKTTDGSYGVTYRWNDAQTEAFLVPEEGMDEVFAINDKGNIVNQTWRYPSRSECQSCHTSVAGHALSFNTRQLNREYTYGIETLNQIEALNNAGYFSTATAEQANDVFTLPKVVPADDTTQSLEFRVRSYLQVNCAQCHQPGGPAPTAWDARITTPLADAGIINGAVNNDGGNSNGRLIIPGSLANSILLHRIQASAGFTRMPPVATNELDPTAIAMLTNWIQNHLPGTQTFEEWQTTHFGSPEASGAGASENPDGDNADNELEFLTGTDPNLSTDQWNFSFDLDTQGAPSFTFDRLANRNFQIEVSTDLINWQIWNVQENAISIPDATINNDTISGATNGEPRLFFRFQVSAP